ncbi:hypothetical protein BJ912DRAFT_1060031 [Pholiota molesta]|nr:hypothetical protein BJ912DRAFT_1060031 [Pholiota molesta]
METLCEIFSCCMDQSLARVLMQPNTRIAPMLLCHVCASWRAIVLAAPRFWSRLRFNLPLDWHFKEGPYPWDRERFARRLEWLSWWRGNLGALAPYLQVELRHGGVDRSPLGRLTESASEFLLEFMSSAQYISVGRIYRYLLQQRAEAGYVVAMHPKAHTVVSTWSPRLEFDYDSHSYNLHQGSVLSQTTSTLRSFAIENTSLRFREMSIPLNSWSTLTHLSISAMRIFLNNWFAFIRSLSTLESGSFHLIFEDIDIETYPRPSIGTLPCLTTFHVNASQHSEDPGHYPLKAAFDNLRLPALRTLSLQSRTATWNDAAALTEVHTALTSAPAITELSLGERFLGGQGSAHAGPFGRTPIKNDIPPLAEGAPRLTHLGFSMWSLGGPRAVRRFVDRVFVASRWLDLKSSAGTVRAITFVGSYSEAPMDVEAEDAYRNLLISEVRKFVEDEVVVRYEQQGPDYVQRAVWGGW